MNNIQGSAFAEFVSYHRVNQLSSIIQDSLIFPSPRAYKKTASIKVNNTLDISVKI